MKIKNPVALWFIDITINLVIILGLVLIIHTWLIAPFDVVGTSMCDTLNYLNDQCESGKGEKIMLNEIGYRFSEPQRGDIVVFKVINEENKRYFIKRIIGLPGDKIELENGKVYLTQSEKTERVELMEPYLNSTNRNNTQPHIEKLRTFKVPDNEFFVMGDNRALSTDSRSCFRLTASKSCATDSSLAFVKRDQIRGKAWIVWWPIPSSIRLIEEVNYPGIVEGEE